MKKFLIFPLLYILFITLIVTFSIQIHKNKTPNNLNLPSNNMNVVSNVQEIKENKPEDIPRTDAKLLIFGDTAFLEPLGTRIVADPTYNPLSNIKDFFNKFDFVVGDLETTIDGTSVGTPNPGKAFTFSIPKESAKLFKDSGIDAFSYANNHTKDYGAVSVLHTIDLLNEAGLEQFGAGANQIDAFKPLIKEINGNKIAFLGINSAEFAFNIASETEPGTAYFNESKVREAIAYTKTQANIVIVIPHWGDEHVKTPNELQLKWADIITSAGADLVIGGHSHVTQDPQIFNGKTVIFSVGNFMFPGQAWDPEAQKGWAIEVIINNNLIQDIVYHNTQMDNDGVPSIID